MMKDTITTDIERCREILRNGGLVAIPTETVYGLAANIYDDRAVKKIFETKDRPMYNPLIVHVHDVAQLPDLTSAIPKAAATLADAFWPGPLTMILDKAPAVSDLITAGKKTVAVRMPKHPMTIELLRGLDFPVAAPSANPFTRVSPTSAQHVVDYFGDKVTVLDGGPCTVGLESTIVGFDGETTMVYRKGGISIEDIEAVVGPVKMLLKSKDAPVAPGMLKKHYSPKTKLVLTHDVKKAMAATKAKRIGILAFYEKDYPEATVVKVLSQKRNLEEAASSLYGALHQLDMEQLDVIIAERFPEEGLGASINDRLERAVN